MEIAVWFSLAGSLLLLMSLGGTLLARQPFSSAMLYLMVGAALSPLWLGWASMNAALPSKWLETLAEVVVLISLFTSGLKLSAGVHDRRWLAPIRLATAGMLITVAGISVAGVYLLGLSWGAAVLLGGILAPTDPVLASDVQLSDPDDRDRLRFALTGEGGMNDGTAFPMVMLGLGLLSLHPLGDFGWRWVGVDVLWAIAAAVAIGALLGSVVGRLVLYLRRTHHEAVGLDNFLALGLIALTYGVTVQLHAYGFLAVFAAGAALRRVERLATSAAPPAPVPQSPALAPDTLVQEEKLATHPTHSSAYMAHAVLSFNEQLDRIGEAVAVVVLGVCLWSVDWQRVTWHYVVFVALMLLVIRPISVAAALFGSRISTPQRRLIGWFGIRGIGSIYYLAYAVNHGLNADLAQTLSALTLLVIAVSVVVHGVSVTPLMRRYRDQQPRVRKAGT
ncbi:MAG: cation:proton antiporter [Pseudorhodobacter sp.]|nr:cation:proton antiporter [Rhizobacter sp.]